MDPEHRRGGYGLAVLVVPVSRGHGQQMDSGPPEEVSRTVQIQMTLH